MGLVKEFWHYMSKRKKFWFLPLLLLMLAIGALIVFGQGSVVAPFIYTIF